jgi:hypothetical protein
MIQQKHSMNHNADLTIVYTYGDHLWNMLCSYNPSTKGNLKLAMKSKTKALTLEGE